MSMRIKCNCDTTFYASDELVGQEVQCPACGRKGPMPAAATTVAADQDTVQYALCPRCSSVRTIGGVLCQGCIYEMHTGRKLRPGVRRWIVPAAIAGGVALVGLIWVGIGL